MIKWDKPCYKCLSHFCDLSCKEPKHLQAPQPKEPEQDQDEVDIRSRLYQRIHELETQLAQPEQEPVAWADHGVVNWIADKQFKHASLLYTTPPQRKPLTDERLELIGHADLAINNIYIFNGYGEEVPEGRTPIYAGYKAAHGIKE